MLNNMIRIIIADDHEVLRVGVRQILQSNDHIEVVAEAESGEQAYELYNKLLPDILVMDMSMPGMGGLEALRRVLAKDNNARVIVFSMHHEVPYALQALSSGAQAYVCKSAGAKDLLTAIKKTMAGKTFLSSIVAEEIALKKLTGEYTAIEQLTAREFEVFCFLANGKKVTEISELLNISHKTVATYQTRIKKKLNIESPIDLVRTAIQFGIID